MKPEAVTLPKMCPNCGHRCVAPTVTLGDTSCDHCKALKQAHGQALEAVRASIANSLRVWLQESDRTFESLSGIISANLELVQPAASTK
jgi:hypothetical protein